jgi:hypothetical protein
MPPQDGAAQMSFSCQYMEPIVYPWPVAASKEFLLRLCFSASTLVPSAWFIYENIYTLLH